MERCRVGINVCSSRAFINQTVARVAASSSAAMFAALPSPAPDFPCSLGPGRARVAAPGCNKTRSGHLIPGGRVPRERILGCKLAPAADNPKFSAPLPSELIYVFLGLKASTIFKIPISRRALYFELFCFGLDPAAELKSSNFRFFSNCSPQAKQLRG